MEHEGIFFLLPFKESQKNIITFDFVFLIKPNSANY